jgi:hypothetical protein
MNRFVAVAVLFVACAPPRVDFREVARSYRADDYVKVRDRWTREAVLRRGISTLVFLTGTYKSWDWRQAYAARMRDHAAFSKTEYGAFLASQRKGHDEAHEFFLSVAMEVRRWMDLTKKESKWHLSLVNERGEEVHARSVKRLRRTNAEVAEFFPYHSSFGEAFVVQFPKTLPDGRPLLGATPRRLTLVLGGPPGRVELTWLGAGG